MQITKVYTQSYFRLKQCAIKRTNPTKPPTYKYHLMGFYILCGPLKEENPTLLETEHCFLPWVHENPKQVVNGELSLFIQGPRWRTDCGNSVPKHTDVLPSHSIPKGCPLRHSSYFLCSLRRPRE